MKNETVLITGAAGFIGYNLALHFHNMNYKVVGWDRIQPQAPFDFQNVKTDSIQSMCDALRECMPDIVIHCAGSADVGKSVLDPEIDYEGNVTLTHNLMFAMHKVGLEKVKFVFLSSAGVYGNPKVLPINEEACLQPLSPYAVHKVMCEELCRYFIDNYNMNVKIARIFSAYGTGLKKQIFWDMYQKSKNGLLQMYGTGNESRDYIYIDDVVQALYLIATKDSDDIVFNVANGEEVTIHNVAEMFAYYVGIPREKIVFNGAIREGDPLNWKADIEKIRRLGYKKSVEMQEGIKTYVKWCNRTK